MKVCIVGAGAIGGFIGARVAATGDVDVSALARGETLAALREHGWRLRIGGETIQSPVTASDNPDELGPQDVIIIAVKAPAMTDIARTIGPMVADDTIVVPAMNGVPWWFSHGTESLGDAPLETVDPGGQISSAIPANSVLGAVVHAGALRIEPGFVEHKKGHELIIGEPSGQRSDRCDRVVEILSSAGFEVTASENIRRDIWYKLWGNMTMNPISVITGATLAAMLEDPQVRELCSDAMREAAEIGARIGCPIDEDPEDRHAVTEKLGAFKTSMLQDAEAGRAIELDALIGVVHEMGTRLGIRTPNIDALLGLTRLYGRVHGLYPTE